MLSKLASIRKHSVGRNATALGVMQIANYAVPLLLLPFLTRQLGMEAFGMVAVTLAAIQLGYVLTDYGFSLSATYSISLNRDDVVYINNKISAVFGAKAFLVILILLTTVVAYQATNYFRSYTPFLIPALIAVIAQAFQPIWLFQGIERMENITIYTVLSKVVYAVLVLLMVSLPEDANLVIYCWSLAQMIGLIASIYFMHAAGYRIMFPTFYSIKKEFKEGAQFFWSRLAVALYTSASTLIVGSHSAVQAAHFSVCEQIYKAGQNVTSPINSAMFPYMARHKDWNVFYKVLIATTVALIAGCLLVFSLIEPLLLFFFGVEYLAAASVLSIFLCTTVINYLGVTFGYPAFSALCRTDIANITVIAGAIMHVFTLAIIYIYFDFDAVSVALAILFTESFVAMTRVACFVYVKQSSSC